MWELLKNIQFEIMNPAFFKYLTVQFCIFVTIVVNKYQIDILN